VRSIVVLGAAIALALTLAACSTATPAASPTSVASPGGDVPPAVAIKDSAFSPAALTVKVGTTVFWTQKDSVPHLVKWADATAPGPQMALGDTYQRKFDTAGTFSYVCGIHSSMKGSVTVTP
jgi:plastocyanin